jgi:hypothetical protein
MGDTVRPGEWIKSSISTANSQCVEAMYVDDGSIFVRNSRDPQGPALSFTKEEWEAFQGGVMLGEFKVDRR